MLSRGLVGGGGVKGCGNRVECGGEKNHEARPPKRVSLHYSKD